MRYLASEEYAKIPDYDEDKTLTIGGQSNRALQTKLDALPLIEDFELILHGEPDSKLGMHASIVNDNGLLVNFPWWDHIEKTLVATETTVIMKMNQSRLTDAYPFADVDQGWNFVTTADDDYQYILQGSDEGLNDGAFLSYFKVGRQKYLDEWQKATEYCQMLAV